MYIFSATVFFGIPSWQTNPAEKTATIAPRADVPRTNQGEIMQKWTLLLFVMLTGLPFIQCKDDGEGNGGGAPNPAAVADAVSNPSGTVADAATAQGVAEAFAAEMESMSSTGAGAAQNGSFDCPNGGNISVSADASGTGTFSYNSCCYEAGCCVDGDGWVAAGTGDYTLCADYSLSLECGEASGSYSVDYCTSTDGNVWYVVEYSGATYTCSGYYNSETGGSWTIRDANATWECQATCTNGTCNGSCSDGTETITW